MKVAIYHNLPSGGGKRALQEMTKRLSTNHAVDIYSLSTAEHTFCDLRPYCRTHTVDEFRPLRLYRTPFGRLNQAVRAVDLYRLRQQQAQVAGKIDGGRYDVVFVHNCRFGQSPSLLQHLRTPSVYYCAEPPRHIYEPPASRPYLQFSRLQRSGNRVDPLPKLYRETLKRLDRANLRSATKVLVNSLYSLESIYRTYGILAQLSPLGVDCTHFQSTGEPKQNFVLSVGAVAPHKGFDFLIKSLALLHHELRPKLVVAANSVEERERDYLLGLATQGNVALDIRQAISEMDLVSLYSRARLTLYAPVMEPFGFVPLESMACGVAVLGVAEGGVRETVQHGKTGWLVERDPRAMAQALAGLLSQTQLLDNLGRAGRQYVTDCWQWDHAIDILLDRLNSVVDSH